MKPFDPTAALVEIDRLIADLDRDLSAAGPSRIGTPWHADRERSRAGLVERRRLLTGEPETSPC
jgi:hypothetical protein